MEDREQGGLTGATGSLTPSDPDDEFIPAETREISDPDAARLVTADTHRRSEDRGARQSDPQGPDDVDERKPQATRGGGYGTGGGLSEEDPAYRMEERAMPGRERPPGDAPAILGGDVQGDPEDEHL
ncbi:MAG TPA: hypothetical protein VHU77_09590 [Candidatus Limnocylindria bacterium]|jgi:hypothetical protein|nr:hypothetical protein [Candidatus Limnocylindria bacterium]